MTAEEVTKIDSLGYVIRRESMTRKRKLNRTPDRDSVETLRAFIGKITKLSIEVAALIILIILLAQLIKMHL